MVNKDSKRNLERLLRICGRRGRVLVLMQNNPDPDAIASALMVREIVRTRLHKSVTIGYGGVLGRAENRAMVHELKVDMHRVGPEDLSSYRTLCLVDTLPRAGNNILFTSRPADIVIDHHVPPKKPLCQSLLSDIRPAYGATSTILYEYLVAAGIKPNPTLATAIFYGIESDTQDLGRETCDADLKTFQAVAMLADHKKLARIRRAPVSPDYFSKLRSGLTNAVVVGRTVITLIHGSKSPDMFAEVAELMLRLDGMRTSICYGPCGDVIHLSVRAIDARGNAAERVKRVVSRIGSGGGHRSMAGGQIPIVGDLDKRLHVVHMRLLKHFARGHQCIPLLPPENGTPNESTP